MKTRKLGLCSLCKTLIAHICNTSTAMWNGSWRNTELADQHREKCISPIDTPNTSHTEKRSALRLLTLYHISWHWRFFPVKKLFLLLHGPNAIIGLLWANVHTTFLYSQTTNSLSYIAEHIVIYTTPSLLVLSSCLLSDVYWYGPLLHHYPGPW